MLYRDPFIISPDITGEELIDVATDAFVSIALARGGDLVEASVGFYDVLVALHWHDEARDLAPDIMQAAYHAARERLKDVTPMDDLPMSIAQMQSFAGLINAAFSGEGREEAV